jgi:hypothetical protein
MQEKLYNIYHIYLQNPSAWDGIVHIDLLFSTPQKKK